MEKTKKDKLVEISFYKKNEQAYNLALLAIFSEVYYIVTLLCNMSINYVVGLTTIANIVVLFLLFTIAIKISIYDSLWTKISFGVTAYFVLRIFVLLPLIAKPIDKVTQIYASAIIACIFLGLASIVSHKKIIDRKKVKEKGEI